MTDLGTSDAKIVFNALLTIEKLVREIIQPDKINLASLGNVVPHLHWHIIPRFFDDAHYPNPIRGEKTNSQYKTDERLYNRCDKLSKELISAFSNWYELYNMQNFVHLRVHSEYSITDSILKVNDIVNMVLNLKNIEDDIFTLITETLLKKRFGQSSLK